jgi:hypothetical protein
LVATAEGGIPWNALPMLLRAGNGQLSNELQRGGD